jgi:uncharacterized Zn-finger protein
MLEDAVAEQSINKGKDFSSSLGPARGKAKIVTGGIKKSSGERRYVCTADGCGKCFVRGEHLKRHVRSLHTGSSVMSGVIQVFQVC